MIPNALNHIDEALKELNVPQTILSKVQYGTLTWMLREARVLALTVNTLLTPPTTKEQISGLGRITLVIDTTKFIMH